jgi:hypothetical protein
LSFSFQEEPNANTPVKEKTLKNLNRVSTAVLLTLVLAAAAFAGEIPTPPCAPGDILTPPCAAAPLSPDASFAPGEVNAPPASNSVDILSVVDAAMNLLLFF